MDLQIYDSIDAGPNSVVLAFEIHQSKALSNVNHLPHKAPTNHAHEITRLDGVLVSH